MTARASADRRESILTAAAEVFEQKGYAATTVEAVTDRAGIAKGSIYNYFQSKRELFTQVFIASTAGEEGVVEDLLARPVPVSEKLSLLLDNWFARQAKYQEIGALVLEFWAAAAREHRGQLASVLQEMYSRWRDLLAGLVAQGIASGEFAPQRSPRQAAGLIMAVLDGVHVQSILNVGIEVDEGFLAALKRTIINALKAGAVEWHCESREDGSDEAS